MIPNAHPAWLLAIAACGGLVIEGCWRDPAASLRYTVRATDPASARVDIRLVLTGVGEGPVVLKGYEPDEYLRIGELTAQPTSRAAHGTSPSRSIVCPSSGAASPSP